MFVLEDLAVLTATGHFNNHITNITAGYSLIPCEWMSKFLSIYHIMTQLCSCCQKGTVNHKRKTDLRISRSVPRRQMCLLRIILSPLQNCKNRNLCLQAVNTEFNIFLSEGFRQVLIENSSMSLCSSSSLSLQWQSRSKTSEVSEL